MYIKLVDIRKRHDGDNIINKISFTAGYGEKIGLIGRNGAGKTTLLRLIAGLESPTSGSITKDPKNMSIIYFQQVVIDTKKTIEDFIIASIPQLGELKDKLNESFDQDLLTQYENAGGYRVENKIKSVLGILGLSKFNEDTPIDTLSGGEKTRLQLAPVIITQPDLLLLDEPTNHLDIKGLEFLEKYVKDYKGTVIIATHDKEFLKNTATRVMELDKGKLFDVKGDFGIFMREKDLLKEQQAYEYKEKQRELTKLRKNLNEFEELSFLAETQTRITRKDHDKIGFNFLAEKAAKKFARRAEVINKKMREYEDLQKPTVDWKIKLDLTKIGHKKVVFDLKKVSKSYELVPVIKDFTKQFYSDEKIVLVGPNGSGKSTLLKLLNKELQPDSGEIKINDTVKIGYLSQEHLEIDINKTIIEDFLESTNVNEATARTYLHKFLFKDYEVYREINTFSQGEKAKYAFAKMLFLRPNFLLLDEPTNYMDLESKEVIENALTNYEGGVIVASHDRNLIKAVAPIETVDLGVLFN